MRLATSFTLLVSLGAIDRSWAFQHLNLPSSRNAVALRVTSKETNEAVDKVPYSISRGDGTTGGGGRAMPNASEAQNELRRPKVGAEMPKGRPSWFKVPAPSQGEFAGFPYLIRNSY